MAQVEAAVQELVDRGVTVLSPADPRIVDQFGDFVFVASDHVRRIKTVQQRHFAAISASDLLWLVAPDGYIGISAAMEITWAAANQTPVFTAEAPDDLTPRQWVTVVPDIKAALARVRRSSAARQTPSPTDAVLLDPLNGLQRVHDDLVVAQRGLLGAPGEQATADAEAALHRARRRLLLP